MELSGGELGPVKKAKLHPILNSILYRSQVIGSSVKAIKWCPNQAKWMEEEEKATINDHSWVIGGTPQEPQQQNVQYWQKLKPIPHRKSVILISFQHNSYIILWHTRSMVIYRWSGLPNLFQQHSDFIDDHSTFFPWHLTHKVNGNILGALCVKIILTPLVTSLYCHSSTSFNLQLVESLEPKISQYYRSIAILMSFLNHSIVIPWHWHTRSGVIYREG